MTKIGSINKRRLLGKEPEAIGLKDAVHTPIISVVAQHGLRPGEYVLITDDGVARRATQKTGVGVVDPFHKGNVKAGEIFWVLVNPNLVSEVRHEWDLEEIDTKIKYVKPKQQLDFRNQYLVKYAKQLGLDYDQFIDDLTTYFEECEPVKYTGTLPREELEKALDELDYYDIWYEWMEATGYQFPNIGTECCPEYEMDHIGCVYGV